MWPCSVQLVYYIILFYYKTEIFDRVMTILTSKGEKSQNIQKIALVEGKINNSANCQVIVIRSLIVPLNSIRIRIAKCVPELAPQKPPWASDVEGPAG